MTESLDEITAQLGALEATIGRLLPRPADTRQASLLALLGEVYRQHRGAYVKINDIAPYATERATYRAVNNAVRQLVEAHEAETIRVAFGQTRHQLVRLVDENESSIPDGFGIGHQLAALLAYLNYEVHVTRSRDIGTNFTKVTVTHNGEQVDAWLHSWPFDVTVNRAEMK